MAQPVQPVEEPVDWLCSSGQVPVEGGQKVFLSPNGLLFPIEVRSKTGLGPAETQRSLAKHLMLTASQPVDP